MSKDKPVLTQERIEEIRNGSGTNGDEIAAILDLALSALTRQGKWVPLEPTPEMTKAGNQRVAYPRHTRTSDVAKDCYRAMLAAAPHNDHEPPQDFDTAGHHDRESDRAAPASGSPDEEKK